MRAVRSLFAVLAVVSAAATASAHEATSKGVTVAHPWTRATPGGATVGAAFMEIRTDKGVTDRLISAASPVAGRVEVHTHIMDGEVMKMRRVEALDLKDGASHVLKPMGDHIMFFDLKQPLKEGDLVKIQLTFEKAGVVEVEGTVEPAGAMGPHGMDRQPGHEEKAGKAGGSDGKSGHEHMGHP
jgi:periplasmic copper chaperone A